ncbi:hypothetical protein WJX79_007132 [Trebouxia sp. C0005]
MTLFCQLGFFSPKVVPTLQVLPLAAAYVGYVVLNNLSLRLNTVGFYQISKICIMPTLIAIEIALFGKYPSKKVLAAVVLLSSMQPAKALKPKTPDAETGHAQQTALR